MKKPRPRKLTGVWKKHPYQSSGSWLRGYMKERYMCPAMSNRHYDHDAQIDSDGEFTITTQSFSPSVKSVLRHAKKQFKRRKFNAKRLQR